MSKEDLRPCRTAQEARERGRKGGIASGEARRKKRALRELVAIALEEAYNAGSYPTPLESRMNGRPMADLVAARLVHKAAQGDLKAMSILFNLEGEGEKQEPEEVPEAEEALE